MIIDLGDTVLSVTLNVKGQHLRVHGIWRMGAPRHVTPDVRLPGGVTPPYRTPPKEIDLVYDIQADKMVDGSLTLVVTDEMGNPVPTPPGASITYAGDDPAHLVVTDNGDGSFRIQSVGPLTDPTTPVNVTASVTGLPVADKTFTEQVNVVAGDAQVFNASFTFGTPAEVTPDA